MMQAICQLAPTVITLPTLPQIRSTTDDLFASRGLPNFILGVDGTHITLGLHHSEKDLPSGIQTQDFWCR